MQDDKRQPQTTDHFHLRRRARTAKGWAMLDVRGRIMPNSVRDTAAGTRLAAGEGKVVPILISIDVDQLISDRFNAGESVAELAKEFNVSKTAIYRRVEDEALRGYRRQRSRPTIATEPGS